jgi:Domain of unknown function (DUF3883)
MIDVDPSGTDWTSSEIDLVVADYFEMLSMDLSDCAFNKAERNRALQELTGRSRGSIEFKHQNISAVLVQLGETWLTGYLPRANFQKALLNGVERYLDRHLSTLGEQPVRNNGFLAESSALFIEQPPSLNAAFNPIDPNLERIVRKFDPASRDARNRALGKSGEEAIFQFEVSKLMGASRLDLAAKVRWISEEYGDGAGYDILSFDAAGKERLIEVKTTRGGQTTPFFISENERRLSEERHDAFRLVRIYDFARTARAYELVPPLAHSVILRAANYRASFQ